MGILRVEDFDLESTVESGQIFRYEKVDGSYYITYRDRIIRLKQDGRKLMFEGASEAFVRHYLRLDEDYKKMIRQLSKDPNLRKAISSYPGLRLIRQDPWECTVSFICSQMSNIPRIKKNMNSLAQCFGREIRLGDYRSFSLDSPSSVNDLKRLQGCALGFRDKYIHQTAARLTEDELASYTKLDYEEAKRRLMLNPGIGPKVADCILLFSLGFDNAFPVDVWIERIMKELYFKGKKKVSQKQIVEFAQKRFGPYAGYANQFLYHYHRNR